MGDTLDGVQKGTENGGVSVMEITGAGYASGEVGYTPFCTPVTMKQDGTEWYFERKTGRKWRVEWGENGGKGVCCDMYSKIQISPSP